MAQAERYEAMMAAVAKDDDEDYDFEDDLEDEEENGLDGGELAEQRKLLASVAQQVSKHQQLAGRSNPGAVNFDEMEDHDEMMRQIYEENLLLQQAHPGGLADPAQ